MAHSTHRHRHGNHGKTKKILTYSVLGINILFVVLMILCAFSGTLPPQDYPRLSVLPLLFPFMLLANMLFLVIWLFVKWRFALVSAAGMLICISDIRGYLPLNFPSNAPHGSIKIMSYNIGNREKDSNQKLIDYILNKANSDILCLQEYTRKCNIEKNSIIKQQYPYIEFDSQKASTIACLSRFPIVSVKNIKYKSAGNESSAYKIKVDDDTLLVVNNHFQSYKMNSNDINEYKGITSRSADLADREKGTKDIFHKIIEANKTRGPQVDSVYKYLESNAKQYTVVLGDFNEPTTSYAHYMLTKNFKDAYTRTGNGFGFTYSRNRIHYRIDHILYSDNIEVYEADVDKSCHISDHYPIFCYIKLE